MLSDPRNRTAEQTDAIDGCEEWLNSRHFLRSWLSGAGIHSIERLREFSKGAGEADRAAINRSLARSLAKIGEADEALRLASEALVQAEAKGDVRAIGNAHLALGEAMRHAGKASDALAHYRDAIDFGSASGNRDSELWSRMGEVAALLQEGELGPAGIALAAAAALANEPGFEHPLESAHVALLCALIAVLAGNAADKDAVLALYRRLGISWPEEYLQETHAGQALTRAVPL